MASTSLAAMKLCPSSLGALCPDGELLGAHVPWQGPRTPCRKHGASFVCLVPPGKAHCSSTLGELPRLGALAAVCSSAGWQARVSRRDPGKPGWLLLPDQGCGVIKTCKVFPWKLPVPGITAPWRCCSCWCGSPGSRPLSPWLRSLAPATLIQAKFAAQAGDESLCSADGWNPTE